MTARIRYSQPLDFLPKGMTEDDLLELDVMGQSIEEADPERIIEDNRKSSEEWESDVRLAKAAYWLTICVNILIWGIWIFRQFL